MTQRLRPTLNHKGSMHPLTQYSRDLLQQIKSFPEPVVDIGCAFGNFVIPALQQGNTIVAHDIEQRHLDEIKNSLPDALLKNLTFRSEVFPEELAFAEQSIAAIHIAFVISLFTPQQITLALQKMYCWLKPGGLLCIIGHSPYLNNIKRFIPEYEKRKLAGEPWPGLINDTAHYFDDVSSDSIRKNLPSQVLVYDAEDMQQALIAAGFIVEQATLFTPDFQLPDDYCYDGREYVITLAKKS